MSKIKGRRYANRRDAYLIIDKSTGNTVSKCRNKGRAIIEKSKLENSPFYNDLEIIDNRFIKKEE